MRWLPIASQFGSTGKEDRIGICIKPPRARDRRRAMASDKVKVTRGSGNVFKDLDFEDSDELQAEAPLAHQIYTILKRRKLSQRAAAKLLGIAPADVNKLMNGNHAGFSIRRLAVLLTRLGRDVEIIVKRAPRSRAQGQIRVTAV